MREPICFECAVAEADERCRQSNRIGDSDAFFTELVSVLKDRKIVGESCEKAIRARSPIVRRVTISNADDVRDAAAGER